MPGKSRYVLTDGRQVLKQALRVIDSDQCRHQQAEQLLMRRGKWWLVHM
jgi:hypothetical protein